MCDKLVLVGGGGHCRAVIDVAEGLGYKILGILERAPELTASVMGYPIIGTDEDIPRYVSDAKFVVTVGYLTDCGVRQRLHEMIKSAGGQFATLISPKAYVSKHATLGDGTVVMNYANINAMAQIGQGCIINSCSNIEHDTIIQDYSHVSTGAMVNGGCNIGHGVMIGSGAVVINGISVADGCIIGAGAVVADDITQKGVYVGIPAQLNRSL